VRLTDGTVPPDAVMIERVCNGRVRPEGYTDSKGNFSFQVGGQPGIAFGDASIGNSLPFEPFGAADTGLQGNVSPRDLTGCEIRGNLAGFQSSSIMLTFRQALDDPDIGVIHLRRLANVEGFTFSVTTAAAPKDARNAYEKGLGNVKKQKWQDAERDFLKAVQVYPRYAVAWYELGRVYGQQKKFDEASRAQSEAVKIDPKYVSPYSQLALVAALQQKWDDVVLHSSQVMKLNPDVSPDIYFYSAVAHYNLQKIDVAKDHARQAATRDTQQRNPRINHLLGVILAQTQEYKEAAENLRTYLKLTPNAPDAATVNQMLSEIDARVAEQPPRP
jgi:Flp pilus assembly protein TadD